MLLRWGIVRFRLGDSTGAAEKFRRVLEEYPSGSAAAQASSFLQRLQK
ncbi:MAG: tetratricopeptide repeat protein [Kiritimatiellae bacterium]|nr:tetratricopeptide repeat protein [Kiritimatiellia bacterium]